MLSRPAPRVKAEQDGLRRKAVSRESGKNGARKGGAASVIERARRPKRRADGSIDGVAHGNPFSCLEPSSTVDDTPEISTVVEGDFRDWATTYRYSMMRYSWWPSVYKRRAQEQRFAARNLPSRTPDGAYILYSRKHKYVCELSGAIFRSRIEDDSGKETRLGEDELPVAVYWGKNNWYTRWKWRDEVSKWTASQGKKSSSSTRYRIRSPLESHHLAPAQVPSKVIASPLDSGKSGSPDLLLVRIASPFESLEKGFDRLFTNNSKNGSSRSNGEIGGQQTIDPVLYHALSNEDNQVTQALRIPRIVVSTEDSEKQEPKTRERSERSDVRTRRAVRAIDSTESRVASSDNASSLTRTKRDFLAVPPRRSRIKSDGAERSRYLKTDRVFPRARTFRRWGEEDSTTSSPLRARQSRGEYEKPVPARTPTLGLPRPPTFRRRNAEERKQTSPSSAFVRTPRKWLALSADGNSSISIGSPYSPASRDYLFIYASYNPSPKIRSFERTGRYYPNSGWTVYYATSYTLPMYTFKEASRSLRAINPTRWKWSFPEIDTPSDTTNNSLINQQFKVADLDIERQLHMRPKTFERERTSPRSEPYMDPEDSAFDQEFALSLFGSNIFSKDLWGRGRLATWKRGAGRKKEWRRYGRDRAPLAARLTIATSLSSLLEVSQRSTKCVSGTFAHGQGSLGRGKTQKRFKPRKNKDSNTLQLWPDGTSLDADFDESEFELNDEIIELSEDFLCQYASNHVPSFPTDCPLDRQAQISVPDENFIGAFIGASYRLGRYLRSESHGKVFTAEDLTSGSCMYEAKAYTLSGLSGNESEAHKQNLKRIAKKPTYVCSIWHHGKMYVINSVESATKQPLLSIASNPLPKSKKPGIGAIGRRNTPQFDLAFPSLLDSVNKRPSCASTDVAHGEVAVKKKEESQLGSDLNISPMKLRKPRGRKKKVSTSLPVYVHEEKQLSNDKHQMDTVPELLLKPETRPISQGQLIVEVRGIYAGLEMSEAESIELDPIQAIEELEPNPYKPEAEVWGHHEVKKRTTKQAETKRRKQREWRARKRAQKVESLNPTLTLPQSNTTETENSRNELKQSTNDLQDTDHRQKERELPIQASIQKHWKEFPSSTSYSTKEGFGEGIEDVGTNSLSVMRGRHAGEVLDYTLGSITKKIQYISGEAKKQGEQAIRIQRDLFETIRERDDLVEEVDELQDAHIELQETHIKLQNNHLELQENYLKLHQTISEFQIQVPKLQEENLQHLKDYTRLQDEYMKLQDEHIKLQEDMMHMCTETMVDLD